LQRKDAGMVTRKRILEGGQQGLWKGLRLALSKPVEPIPKEIKSTRIVEFASQNFFTLRPQEQTMFWV